MGYGPVRYLRPHGAAEVTAALDGISADTLRERFGDGRHLTEAEIYPGIWHDNPASPEYVLTNFKHLVRFYRRAADPGRAVLLFLV